MIYKCRRCGHTEKHKGNFLKHLNRKNICKPIIENIDIETLKLENEEKNLKFTQKSSNNLTNPQYYLENQLPYTNNINESEENFIKLQCEFCKKKYSRIDNLKRHLNSCKRKKETLIKNKNDIHIEVINENKELEIAKKEAEMAKKEAEIAKKEAEMEKKEAEMIKRDGELKMLIQTVVAQSKEEKKEIKEQMELVIGQSKDQLDFMRNQIEILMKNAGNNITNNTDNSITNNDNKQINIHINGFGKEDLSYLTDRYFRELFNIPFSAITQLIEDIHFNPKKPQNWNAKISDDKTSKALVYNAEKEMWVKREKKDVINDMVEKSYNMLDTNFEIQKEAKKLDEKGLRKFTNFMKEYDKGSKDLDKRYETAVREMLMNYKEYHDN